MSYEQGSVVTVGVEWDETVTDLRLTIRSPDNDRLVLGFADVDPDSPRAFHYDLIASQVGDYYYLWEPLNPGIAPREGSFQVDENVTTSTGVTDARDVRVMIPRVRRAIDGPQATSPLSESTTLNDEEVTALIADSISDIILNTGSAFGHTLEVVARDPYYYAPTAWLADPEFNLAEVAVVVTQAALNFYFHKFQDLKVSEEISDEGQTWNWSLSASLIRDQMKMLQDQRDKALAIVMRDSTLAMDSYVSFIEVRDKQTSLYIEPWIADNGGIGGQESQFLVGYDPRFQQS